MIWIIATSLVEVFGLSLSEKQIRTTNRYPDETPSSGDITRVPNEPGNAG